MNSRTVAINHIIVAEDDQDDKLIFGQAILEIDTHLQVTYVSDGVELLSLINNFLPDLLVLDLDMPYKNGLECLLAIRHDPALQQLPVLVFSSTTQTANIQTAYELGAHLYAFKSNSYSEYVKALRNILQLDWSQPDTIREQYCRDGRYLAFNKS